MKTFQLLAIITLLSAGMMVSGAFAADTISFAPSSVTIDQDETVDLTIMMDSVPTGLSGYDMTISFSDTAIAEITAVQYPGWAMLPETSALPAPSVDIKAVDFNLAVGPGATNIEIATVTLRGLHSGTADVLITANQIDDDSGDLITPAINTGSVEVLPPTLSIVPQSASIVVNDTTDIDLVLDRALFGLSGYKITLTLADPTVGEFTAVSYPAWAALTDQSPLPDGSVWIKAMDLNSAVEGDTSDLILGTITLHGLAEGTSAIEITVDQLDDDNGDLITPSTTNGELTVTAGAEPVAILTPGGGANSGYTVPTTTPTTPAQTEFTTNGTLTLDEDGSVSALTEIWETGKNAYLLIDEGVIPLGDTGVAITNISILAIPPADVPPANGGSVFSFAGYAFECSPSGVTFDPSITITFVLSEEEWNAIGSDDFVIEWYNEEIGAWETIPTSVDPITRTVSAEVTHFTLFALFAQTGSSPEPAPTQQSATTLPTAVAATATATDTAAPATTALQGEGGIPWLWLVGAIIVLGLVVGAHRLLEWEKEFDEEHGIDYKSKK
jgi:hypothetical protein